jgi:mono/diheme cytochrome c family protein
MLIRLFLFIAALIVVPRSSPAQPHAVEADGRALYLAACVNCHGEDGSGATRAQVGFADAIPDFTDCSFASREAAQDWFAVVHDGGPVRAFSRRMPAFGSALTTAQIERVVDYVRSLCDDASWPRGELNLPRTLATEKAFPEDELVIAADAVTRRSERAVTTRLIYERRFGARNQWEIAVPVGVRDDGRGSLSRPAAGDISLGLKRAMFHRSVSGTLFSGLAEVVLPTGSRRTGMGSGSAIFEPSLLFAQVLPANGFVQAQAGAELAARRRLVSDELFARVALGTTIAQGFGRSFSPIVEVTAAREIDSGARQEWDLVPQLQVSLSRRQHILASIGVLVPMTDRPARPWRLQAYVLWDWFDGGLLAGWR